MTMNRLYGEFGPANDTFDFGVRVEYIVRNRDFGALGTVSQAEPTWGHTHDVYVRWDDGLATWCDPSCLDFAR